MDLSSSSLYPICYYNYPLTLVSTLSFLEVLLFQFSLVVSDLYLFL